MKRLENLRKVLSEKKLDAILITKDANQRYFEGFLGSECYYLVTGKVSYLIADSRYTEMAAHDCENAEVVPHRDPYPPFNEVIASVCRKNGVKDLGFEADNIRYAQYAAIQNSAAPFGVKMTPTSDLCEDIRAVKDAGEIEYTQKACDIADKALGMVTPKMKPGVSEKEVVRMLEGAMCDIGADGISFDTMVLFGARSSQPHAVPSSEVKLKEGDLVLIDYGAAYRGYRSDTTRTFVSGAPDAKQKENYARVLRSQLAGIEMVKDGGSGFLVDKASRDLLLGDGCFSYGVGHGVGLEIHEQPFMRRTTNVKLSSSMILTVEPGIYLPGWGGIRIEDTVLVTDGGYSIMTHFPKDELMSL